MWQYLFGPKEVIDEAEVQRRTQEVCKIAIKRKTDHLETATYFLNYVKKKHPNVKMSKGLIVYNEKMDLKIMLDESSSIATYKYGADMIEMNRDLYYRGSIGTRVRAIHNGNDIIFCWLEDKF